MTAERPPPHSTTTDNIHHILSRPETYNGSVEKQTENTWIWKNDEMIKETITFVPALYKIFNEVLVNAADNKQRDSSLDCIKVDIDVARNLITFWYNGDGKPVYIIPNMPTIFLTMIEIHAADGKQRYNQMFTRNGSAFTANECQSSENWIMVSFKPDLEKFGMKCLEEDIVSLMKRRVVDLAGCVGMGVKVELDGKRVPLETFGDYAKLYPRTDDTLSIIHEKVNDSLEICIGIADGNFEQVSFVNNIATMKGGSHVDYIAGQITSYLGKIMILEPDYIKSYLWVFVNALIDKPTFDSQTKESLTTNKGSFGTTCKLTPQFLKKIANSDVMEELFSYAASKQNEELEKTDGKREWELIIPKLEDAHFAGTAYSEDCTLVLTQGESAKAFAMSGLSLVAQDYYGVFPLKGELLNVREASREKLQKNAEIQNIKKILGLEDGKFYENVNELRYGRLMIMADQDHDGSHVKGLLMNFFHSFWPSLLKVPNFMLEFITPIVKASNEKDKEVLLFYTMPEYEAWKKNFGNEATEYKIKYCKWLGTSEEVAECFADLDIKCFADLDIYAKPFFWADDEDGYAIELAFSKKKIKARKDWLRAFQAGTYFDSKQKRIRYRDFINKELILFSNQRSIPSMVDGLKPGERKILLFALKEPITKDITVSRFICYSARTAHHDEASLVDTIIGMAQNYVGSNNINLLQPKGGTRLMGGKDRGGERCISTLLSPITRYIFHKADELLLNYLNYDGQSIEPAWFIPIIPMVLANGSAGKEKVGLCSFIPNYNPRDIIANLKHLLNGEAMVPMHPWYKGFKGTIKKKTASASKGYTTTGIMKKFKNALRITELPVGRSAQDYKDFLDKTPFIEAYTTHNDDKTVHLKIFMTEDQMNTTDKDLLKKFKLTTTLSTANMYLFDAKGVVKKYDTPEQILEEFFHIRLEFYEKRRRAQLRELEKASLLLLYKVRFIRLVCDRKINLINRNPGELWADLEDKGFKKETEVEEEVAAGEENWQGNASKTVPGTEYDYLLSMDPRSWTYEMIHELQQERDAMEKEINVLSNAPSRSLWITDLDDLDYQLQLDGNYPSPESSPHRLP